MSTESDSYLAQRDAALAIADRVFVDLPGIGRLDGCGYCYSEEELVQLGGDPRAVSDDLVRQFAYEGIDHWNEDEYQPAWRRLAARILRLVDDAAIDVGLLLRGLGYSCNTVEDWPAQERDAVLDVLRATLDLWLADGRDAADVVELLGGLAHVHNDLTPWFTQIETSSSPVIEAALVRLAADWSADCCGPKTRCGGGTRRMIRRRWRGVGCARRPCRTGLGPSPLGIRGVKTLRTRFLPPGPWPRMGRGCGSIRRLGCRSWRVGYFRSWKLENPYLRDRTTPRLLHVTVLGRA